MFDANEYRQLARVHAELIKLAGTPPFTVALGDETEEAPSFEELRRAVLDVAAKGVKLQRFKGLGEMNAEQLRETTMDPTTRTLAQVTMDDAAAADRAVHDADGRQGRAAPRVHRGERPRRHARRLDDEARPEAGDAWPRRPDLERQHRAPRARGGDALLLPGLRDVASSSGARCPTSATA